MQFTNSDNFSVFSGLTPVDSQDFEIVERKGIGHPDTLADGIAEVLSNEYSKYCLSKFGAILHHNLDKVAIIGGLVDIDFGRGKMLEPAKIIVNGRMSDSFGDHKINIARLQNQVVKQYIKKVLPHINVDRWIKVHSFTNSYSHSPYWYHPRNLDDLPERTRPHANDTSACVGYWPLSILENLVLNLEKYFYTRDQRPKLEFIGQDIKFMAVREGKDISITTCIPFISTKTPSPKFYQKRIDEILEDMRGIAKKTLPKGYKVEIFANTADRPEKNDYYLLLTGACIEAGEEGVVGRGNKTRGVISSVRPHSMEAPHGKNPVYHVGKVFSVVADSMSRVISERFGCECSVYITTRNKDDLFSPHKLIIQASKRINETTIYRIVEKHLNYRGWTKIIVGRGLLVPKVGSGNTFRIQI